MRKLTAEDKIHRANLDGSNVEVLVAADKATTNELDSPDTLVLDVEGGKMYWMIAIEVGGVDVGWFQIHRANLDGSNVEDLVAMENWNSPALSVTSNKIYWTFAYKIHRANLDGSNVEVLITTELGVIGGIALDVTGGKIYWVTWTE